MKGAACAVCIHWTMLEIQVSHERQGNCHRFPPVPTSRGPSEWPVTAEKDICGEFKRA